MVRVIKDITYYKLVMFIYKISNDNKTNRIYCFNITIDTFKRMAFDPIYHNMLLIDLNIFDEYQENANNNNIKPTINAKDEIDLHILLHDILLQSYHV